jgi:hypothetical protein
MMALPYIAMAMSAIAQGNATSAQYKAQAQADMYNAAINRQRAETTNAVTVQRETQQRRESRIKAGERLTAMAQSGTGLGGSNADVFRQSEVLAELDALNIRYEGELESKGLLNQANLNEWQSRTNLASAKRARMGGYVGAAASLLSGASKMSSSGPSISRPVYGYN